jgi:hypothetical protein
VAERRGNGWVSPHTFSPGNSFAEPLLARQVQLKNFFITIQIFYLHAPHRP